MDTPNNKLNKSHTDIADKLTITILILLLEPPLSSPLQIQGMVPISQVWMEGPVHLSSPYLLGHLGKRAALEVILQQSKCLCR